jgi:large subunit ribosomal protein L19
VRNVTSSATSAKTKTISNITPTIKPKTLPQGYSEVKWGKDRTLHAYQGKLKNSYKRAGGLMNELDKELVQHSINSLKRPQWDEVRPGDAVEILYKETGASLRSQMASGVVIGTKRLGGYNATVRVMSVLGPHPIEYHFPLYSPLVSHVRLVESRFIHKGMKRVKRAKLYYMRTRPIGELRTPPSEFTKAEKEKALVEARRVSAEAKMGKKEKAELAAKKNQK